MSDSSGSRGPGRASAAANVLSALRDIEGVLGSFLIDMDGNMLARDLPPLFASDALARSGIQLARLRSALESAGSEFEACTARFGPHLLLLRAAHSNTLCVLCPHGTNLAAVQMSSTLIARRLYGPAPAGRPTPVAPQSLATPTPFDGELDDPGTSPARRFRGRRV